jgi:hypothetical protein
MLRVQEQDAAALAVTEDLISDDPVANALIGVSADAELQALGAHGREGHPGTLVTYPRALQHHDRQTTHSTACRRPRSGSGTASEPEADPPPVTRAGPSPHRPVTGANALWGPVPCYTESIPTCRR